jgi:hypothetical protein
MNAQLDDFLVDDTLLWIIQQLLLIIGMASQNKSVSRD